MAERQRKFLKILDHLEGYKGIIETNFKLIMKKGL